VLLLALRFQGAAGDEVLDWLRELTADSFEAVSEGR